jgi:pSer/pThr/pTyr-binding forkhead associated (FHA) protein
MNGTFVDGRRLESGVPVELAEGNVLRIGLVDLRLRCG